MSEQPIVYPRRISHAPEVLVLGGGIIGLSIARALDDLGLRVDVLEAHQPGAGASNAAAGMLSPVAESPERPEFLRTLVEARNLWPDWAEQLRSETAIDLDFAQSGSLFPAFDTSEMEYLDRIRSAAQALGEPAETVDSQALQDGYPELSPKVRQALLLPDEARVDNTRVIEALSESLFRRGVIVHRQREVTKVHRDGDTLVTSGEGWHIASQFVVVAAGAWSSKIGGIPKLPLAPVRGQILSFHVPDWEWNGTIRCARYYAVKRGSGDLLVGATVEDAGFDASVTDSAKRDLVEFAHHLFPKLRWKAVHRHWAGLRPASSDGQPIIGPLAEEGVFAATGHYRNGILLAPWTAKLVAEFFKSGDESVFPASSSPERFRTKTP